LNNLLRGGDEVGEDEILDFVAKVLKNGKSG